VKSHIAVSIVISILIASVFGASYVGYTTILAASTHSFTLQLTGTAYDPQKHAPVNVVLYVTGSADGKLKTLMDLDVKDGDVSVNPNYGTFYVSWGSGELVSCCHYFMLCIWLIPKYGGRIALWCLSGRTGTLLGQTLKVSLDASHVILPMNGSPRLDDLDLSGTIALVS